MGRINQSSKSVVASMIYYALKTIMSLVIRTAFIYVFGMEFLGLSSIFANVLTILSLAELGIGSAIVFNMYKPMAEQDYDKVSALLALYKKFYLVVALFILVVGVAITPLLPKFIDYESVQGVNINIIYFITLASTLVSYFMAHRRALFLTSQKKYIETIVSIASYLTITLMQLVILFTIKNYYIYVGLGIVFSLLESVIIYITTKKLFPMVGKTSTQLSKDTKKEIWSNTRSIMCHKVGAVVLNSTDSLVIQLVLGSLLISAQYSNYWMIYTTIVSIIVMVMDSMHGSIGNLIAVNDSETAYSTFKRLNFLFGWIIGFCAVALLCLYNPFISTMWGTENVWGLGFVITVVSCFYINMSRQLAYYFKISAGLFSQDKYAPLIEAGLNIVISVVLAYFMGATGVVLGTVISCLLVPFWNIPRILFKHYFKKPFIEYWRDFIKFAIVTLFVGLITFLIVSIIPGNGWDSLLLKFVIVAVIPNMMFMLVYIRNKEFKYFVEIFKNAIKNFIKKVMKKIKKETTID